MQPATHRGEDRHGQPSVAVAVPAGSVVFYSPNLLHRGRANEHPNERIILTLTLMGAHGLIPNGIPLAVQPEDDGRWWLADGRLVDVEASRGQEVGSCES